jgi:hypothetical protein
LQHRFCEAHKAYTGRGQFPYTRRLMGDRSPDSMYEKKGLPLPTPAFVGDKDRAEQVYLNGNAAGKTAITFSPLSEIATKRIAA